LAKAQRRLPRRKEASSCRKKTAVLLACAQLHVKRHRADHHQTALALLRRYVTIDHAAIRPATLSRPAPIPDGDGGYLHAGAASSPSSRARQHASASAWQR
jgi:hypothetical protein